MARDTPVDRRWNLNIHYHSIVVDAAPPVGSLALDIGCGDGLLTFDLTDEGFHVVGIDVDAPSIERARADPRAGVHSEFVVGDVFEHDVPQAAFDLVASSATLHHLDAQAGLRRMRSLVRPNGVVVVVGFARASGLVDHVLAVAGRVRKLAHTVRGDYWEHGAPTRWPPPLTIREMRELAATELPGCSFGRLMSNRYSIVWHAPAEHA